MPEANAQAEPGDGHPAKIKQITAAGVLIAAFFVAASFYVSHTLTGRFTQLETAALWRQTDTANRLVRNELTQFLYQLQFATFETVPQFLASSDDYDTLAPFFARLRANALDVDAAFLFDASGQLAAANSFSGEKRDTVDPADPALLDAVTGFLLGRAAAPASAFLPVADTVYFVAANPVIDLRRADSDRNVGTLVFCRALAGNITPDPGNPDTVVRFSPAIADVQDPQGTTLPALTGTSASWDPSEPITIAFPDTTTAAASLASYYRLQEIRNQTGATWPVNLILANRSPVDLHRTLSSATLSLLPPSSPPGGGPARSLVTAALDQGDGLPPVEIATSLPPDYSMAIASSRRLVLFTSATAALLIALFTAYVIREVLRRYRLEREFAFTSHQKDQLLSVIAHDLRAPLTGVGNLARLMANTDASFTREELEPAAQEIHLTSKRLTELLENLLSWAHLKSGRLPITPAAVHFPRLVNQVARLFGPAGSAKAITVGVSTGSVTTVHSDAEILRTVFRNLLSNAIRHTPEGGSIDITAERTNTDLHFAVADTGEGSPADKVAAALSDPRGSVPKAKGFGLVLCREMVEMLGGTIRAENRPGGGCIVSVTIPGAAGDKPSNTQRLKTKEQRQKSTPDKVSS